MELKWKLSEDKQVSKQMSLRKITSNMELKLIKKNLWKSRKLPLRQFLQNCAQEMVKIKEQIWSQAWRRWSNSPTAWRMNSSCSPVSLLSSVVQTIINVINVIFISPIFLMSYFCVVLYNYFLQCNAGHEKLIFSLVQEWKDWKCMQINFSSCNCSVETWFYANGRKNKRFISSFSPSCRKTIST